MRVGVGVGVRVGDCAVRWLYGVSWLVGVQQVTVQKYWIERRDMPSIKYAAALLEACFILLPPFEVSTSTPSSNNEVQLPLPLPILPFSQGKIQKFHAYDVTSSGKERKNQLAFSLHACIGFSLDAQ